MVDRDARRALGRLLRQLASGRISNDQYEAALPPGSRDRAVRQIHSEGAWYLYDDLRQHRLTGRDRLDRRAKREVARWILFLSTDLEYEWPTIPGAAWLPLFLLSAVTFGLAGGGVRRAMRRGGDVEVWPFRRRADYESALQRPPFLAGVGAPRAV